MSRRQCTFNETLSLFTAVNCSDCETGGGITTNCALFDFVLFTIVGGTLCAFGLVGNVLSFIVLSLGGDHSSKTAATIFLLRALAVADSLVLLTSLPLYDLVSLNVYAGHFGAFHRFYMVVMPYLWPLYLMSLTATILLTVLVSFHRYTAVCKPYNSVTLSSLSRCRRHVAFVAAAAVIYNIPRFFEYRRVDVFCQTPAGQTSFVTSIHLFTDIGEDRIFRVLYDNICYFVVMLGGPLVLLAFLAAAPERRWTSCEVDHFDDEWNVLLAFLNAKLIMALKEKMRKRREMRGVATTVSGHNQQQQQQDLTVTLVVVVFVFIVCQTPTFVDRIVWAFVDDGHRLCGRWHYYYTAVGDLMVILNSSVNFIVYVLASRKFRQDLFAIRLRTSSRPAADADAGRSQRADSQRESVANRVLVADFDQSVAAVELNTRVNMDAA